VPSSEIYLERGSVSLGISKIPECFIDLYRDWFNTHSGRDRKAVIVGSVTVVWVIWKTRNNFLLLLLFVILLTLG
jgi:hypothetical protein